MIDKFLQLVEEGGMFVVGLLLGTLIVVICTPLWIIGYIKVLLFGPSIDNRL